VFCLLSIGRILNKFSKDIDALDSLLPIVFQNVLTNVFILISSIGICAGMRKNKN
jgi:hypothetical protein